MQCLAAVGCAKHDSDASATPSPTAVAPSSTAAGASIGHRGPAGASKYASVIVKDHPVAYFRLNELSGTTAIDSSGHHHNGTYHGTVGLNRGTLLKSDANASSASFTSGYMTESATWTDQAVTAECWIKPSAADVANTASPRIMGNAWADHDSTGYMLYINQGKPGFWAGWKSTYGTSALQADAVYHVVGTYSPSTGATLYVNGAQVSNSPGNGPSPQKGDSDTTYIGALNAAGGAGISANFQGEIADCAAYDRALPPNQVGAHYAAGSR